MPDFVFRHEDGRIVLMEVIGFWTPEYLEAKLKTLRDFRDSPILLAVAEPLRRKLPELTREIVPFKSALKIQDVLARLQT